MDGKSSGSRSLIRGKSCSFQNLQDSMQVNSKQLRHPFQGFMVSSNAQARDAFSIRNINAQKPDGPISFLEMRKKSCDEDSSYAVGENVDGNNESEREKKESPWQRVKWTDQMVKLLITAVSYIAEDASSERKSSPLLPKKGKWKAVSKVMAERGFLVSPQQCEDKFNDLNKRYKKLNDMLGRGTCCEVVENPALLDLMDLSDKKKDSIRKILNSKQLFYQEMCSYHNGNQLYIPHDQAIQRSLLLALRSGDDLDIHEAKACRSDGLDDEEENDASDCPNDNSGEKHAKRKKSREDEYLETGYLSNFQIATKVSSLNDHARIHLVWDQGIDKEWKVNQWFVSRSLQLEEKKLQIEAEMLALEKQRLRWSRLSEVQDRDLEEMKLENKYLKLDNERLALEIKHREMDGRANLI